MWCHYDFLTAPDRVEASPISNRKYKTCLIFTTLDWADSVVIPMIANESEQASCKTKLMPGEPADDVDHRPFVFLCIYKIILQSAGVWIRGLAKSCSVCIQRIIMLDVSCNCL